MTTLQEQHQQRSGSFMLALGVVVAVFGASALHAQVQRGMIAGVARDATGAVLPGVTLVLTSPMSAPREVTSGARGEFRFINLDPGLYDLRASLDGFASHLQQAIVVAVGGSVELVLQLQVAALVEQVEVRDATPVLDTRRHGNVTNFDQAMLHDVPTARDPWALMQQLPGVTINRPNVGGSLSATQATFAARGDDGSSASWNIDGVTITDPVAPGTSTSYFDYNAFDEVQFTTGGLDPRQQTGALSLNIVTKRGTDTWRGLGRLYYSDDNLQQENLPASLQTRGLSGNRINQLAEYGGDIGGPLRRGRAWLWAAAARNDIRQLAFTGFSDETVVNSASVKSDVQLTGRNRLSLFLNRAEKLVTGRFAGVTRPPETTQDQGGPTWITKFEDSHVFGQALFLSAKFAYVDTGFFLTPQGGLTAQAYQDLATQIWHGSFNFSRSERDISQTHVDAVYAAGRHEITFGAVHRLGSALERVGFPGNQVWSLVNVPGQPAGTGWARLTRTSAQAGEVGTLGVYAGDTFAFNRWTVNAGVRFDRQHTRNRPSSAAANGLAPDRMPALQYAGGPRLTWNVFSPRLAATYRMTDRTLARASYARFGGQLPWLATVGVDNPARLAFIEYLFVDANRDNVAQAAEIGAATGFVSNVNPANPGAGFSPNQFDPELTAPTVQALVVGVEHELRPNFAIGVSAGYQHAAHQLWQPLIGLTRRDFVEYRVVGEAGGVQSQTPVFRLAPGSVLPPGNGVRVSNREGYHQRYWNVDVTASKRLANRWMMRGFLTVQRHQEFFDDPSLSVQDPTPRILLPPASGALSSGFVDGGLAIPGIDGYINSKWSYSLVGLYQVPWGIALSGTVYGRQGYPVGEVVQIARDGLGLTNVALERDFDVTRYDDLHLLDARLQKTVAFPGGGVRATFTLDAFNLLNTGIRLRQISQVGTTFRNPSELVPPRVLRLGLQIHF